MWAGAHLGRCYQRQLTPIAGDPNVKGLAIESYAVEVADLLRRHSHLGVRAPPGSGKTIGLPAMLLRWSPGCREAVLLVEPTQYAAQNLVESFVSYGGWNRDRIQLRTGVDDWDRFHDGYTQLSIVAYGMLWKWVTSETTGVAWLLDRYTCFFLDEFAKVVAGSDGAEVLPPQVEELAIVLSKLVHRYTTPVCKDCIARQSEIQKRLRAKSSMRCACPGRAANRQHQPGNEKCALHPRFAGEERWPGKNNGVSRADWNFHERMAKRQRS